MTDAALTGWRTVLPDQTGDDKAAFIGPWAGLELLSVWKSFLADADKPLLAFGDVYSEIYGAQRSLLELYSEWHRQERYRLHFICPYPGELSEAFRELGIAVTHITPGPLLGSFNKRLLNLRWRDYPTLAIELGRYSHALKELLLKLGASLLHCNSDRAGLMSFVGARWARCPMVTHLRRDRTFGWLDRLIHKGTTEMIWVSNRVREEFGRNNNIENTKGRVIYNGRVLPDRDEPGTHADVRNEFGLPDDALLALVVASFDVRKDHETLIRAATIACEQEPRLHFLLAGSDFTPDQERRRKIEQMVADAKLDGRVLFLGHRRDIGRLLRGADLLVNPAKEEALGGALIEAIGYGVPCVATDTGGTAEIVPPGRCGLLAPRQDHAALARCIVDLLRDDDKRRTFAANARTHFNENFTVARCAENTAGFIDEIIERRTRSRVAD